MQGNIGLRRHLFAEKSYTERARCVRYRSALRERTSRLPEQAPSRSTRISNAVEPFLGWLALVMPIVCDRHKRSHFGA